MKEIMSTASQPTTPAGTVPIEQTKPGAQRELGTLKKVARMNKALRHEEPDRVPISDLFWGDFVRRWQGELGLAPDVSPYYHYDLEGYRIDKEHP